MIQKIIFLFTGTMRKFENYTLIIYVDISNKKHIPESKWYARRVQFLEFIRKNDLHFYV